MLHESLLKMTMKGENTEVKIIKIIRFILSYLETL